ncbi:MAG: hypothetical protein QF687_04330 [Nitrospinaceae bacterium]|nr:hypothetical protein [Nitrospinaceae bacterium]MDP7148932.1 hypothetical protein [Nitrospinaceae bacterium]MDP7557091.1 hypothetical protein [Nitrospinaceae bacterium]MEE1550073.1 hypothetical protein [Nitrospinaceae bacterium]
MFSEVALFALKGEKMDAQFLSLDLLFDDFATQNYPFLMGAPF